MTGRESLERDAPEGGVGLEQLEADIPSFVAAPHDLGLGLAASLGMNQANALVEAQIRRHDSHTARVADVHGNGVRAPGREPFFPFDLEFHARDNAFVCA